MTFLFSGWKDPIDLGALFSENIGAADRIADLTVDQYRTEHILRHIEIENVRCQDPEWMESDTFYPKGQYSANHNSFE